MTEEYEKLSVTRERADKRTSSTSWNSGTCVREMRLHRNGGAADIGNLIKVRRTGVGNDCALNINKLFRWNDELMRVGYVSWFRCWLHNQILIIHETAVGMKINEVGSKMQMYRFQYNCISIHLHWFDNSMKVRLDLTHGRNDYFSLQRSWLNAKTSKWICSYPRIKPLHGRLARIMIIGVSAGSVLCGWLTPYTCVHFTERTISAQYAV